MKMHLICACLYSNDAKQIARALFIFLSLSLFLLPLKAQLVLHTSRSMGNVSSSTYCYPAAVVIETQRSAARIVVSFRRAETRLFLTLADRLFVRLSAAKEEKQLKMKLKTFRILLLPLSGCAFRPACSIWQKNKRKATRATKTTVPSSWNPPMLPPFPLLPFAAAHCR